MTVHDLCMTLVNLHCNTFVTAYDDHNKIMPDVHDWGDLMEYYPKSEVLVFDYNLERITLCKVRRNENC